MPNNGIFSLSSYYDKEVSGDIPNVSRETYREYGYFGGGYSSLGSSTTIERIDYSNDTQIAKARSSLQDTKSDLAATGNSNFGYFGGGVPATTSIYRLNYSNDTARALARTTFITTANNRRTLAATGNSNFGYFGGGANSPAPGIFSEVSRIDYNNDTSQALLRGPLSLARADFSATGNSNFGYFGGGAGFGAPLIARIDRINYSNDTAIASVRGSFLLAIRGRPGATGNSNFGYFGGGSPGPVSTVNRISYSNDTVSPSPRSILSLARGNLAATGNSNFGYFGGGPIPASISRVDRIDYSNDTAVASIRGPLSVSRAGLTATSSASFGGSPISQYGVFAKPFGYFGGGSTPSVTSVLDRIDYSNDTSAALIRNTLTSTKTGLTATGNSSFGYFGGGINPALSPAPTLLSTVDRLDYTSDSTTLLTRGPLSLARQNLSTTGNSNFGYFGGGFTASVVSTVDRLSYSTDTSTASVRGSLSIARRNLASTGTSNFGYYGGGYLPAPTTFYSAIDRIDYSNDNATALQRTSLLVATNLLAATGNSNFGYFGGGTVPAAPTPTTASTIYRLDYSNDTAATTARSLLTVARNALTATGTSNFGYFAGGSGLSSLVNRLDYANDTATTTIRGPLSSARSYGSGESASNFGGATDFQATSTFFDIQSMRRIEDTTSYSVKKRALGSFGYFGGGYGVPIPISIVNRLNYSNDTATATVRGSLSSSRALLDATGNNNFGYFNGGWSPGANPTIDRINYSNDTSIASNRTSLSGRYQHTSTGNNNTAYFIGGGPLLFFLVQKLNYSNDTLLSSGVSIKIGRNAPTSVSNSNFGYIVAGANPSVPAVYSSIERINYSNDLSSPSIRGPLNLARQNLAATGNSNFGYFGGGSSSSSIVERIDYSNDTTTASVRGPLSPPRTAVKATGNSNFGYFNINQTVDRIDYSNDTATSSVRGPLFTSFSGHAATTNARNS